MRFEKAKLEQKLKYEKKIDKKRDQNINAKLPKLVITHFKDTPADWLQFWGQFSVEIGAAERCLHTSKNSWSHMFDPQ